MAKKLPLILSLGALVLSLACAHQGAGYGGGAGFMSAYPYEDCLDYRYGYSRYAAGSYAPYAYGGSPIGYGPCSYYRTQYADVYGAPPTIAARQAITRIERRAHPRVVRRPDGPSSSAWSGSSASSPAGSSAVSRAPVAPVAPPAPAPAPAPRTVAPRG